MPRTQKTDSSATEKTPSKDDSVSNDGLAQDGKCNKCDCKKYVRGTVHESICADCGHGVVDHI